MNSSRSTRSGSQRSPRVVVIGGGTGSFTVLRGLTRHTDELAAIVSVMDSGGSSGRLRDEFGALPPGDVRRCLVALSPDDRAGLQLRQLFEYRFAPGEGLNGHSFGNLLLTALSDIAGGLVPAIAAATSILNVRGRVIPVTLDDVHLCAELADGTVIRGEGRIDVREVRPDVPIARVFLDPPGQANPAALAAIAAADLIVIGPGDLYTSIIPNLLVDGVAAAINQSAASLVYVCNIMTKRGETDGYCAADFTARIVGYLLRDRLDFVLVNDGPLPADLLDRYAEEGADPVRINGRLSQFADCVVAADLVSRGDYARHDSARLARRLMELVATVALV